MGPFLVATAWAGGMTGAVPTSSGPLVGLGLATAGTVGGSWGTATVRAAFEDARGLSAAVDVPVAGVAGADGMDVGWGQPSLGVLGVVPGRGIRPSGGVDVGLPVGDAEVVGPPVWRVAPWVGLEARHEDLVVSARVGWWTAPGARPITLVAAADRVAGLAHGRIEPRLPGEPPPPEIVVRADPHAPDEILARSTVGFGEHGRFTGLAADLAHGLGREGTDLVVSVLVATRTDRVVRGVVSVGVPMVADRVGGFVTTAALELRP
jgi:hypothetical protein